MWKQLVSRLATFTFLATPGTAIILYFDGSYRPPPPSSSSSLSPLPANIKLLPSSSLVGVNEMVLPLPSTSLCPIISCGAVLMLNEEEARTILNEEEFGFDKSIKTSATNENICFVVGRCLSSLLMQELIDGKVTSAHAEYEGVLLGLHKLKSLLGGKQTNTTKKIHLAIKGDCKTIIQQISQNSKPRKLSRLYDKVLQILDELERKYNIELENIDLLPRKENVICDSICHISTHTIQKCMLVYTHNVLNQIVDDIDDDSINNNSKNKRYLNYIWNVILCNPTISSYLKLSSSYINYLVILDKLYQKSIRCNHILLLEYIGLAYYIEYLAMPSSYYVAGLDSIIHPSPTPINEMDTTSYESATNNNKLSWKEYLFLKGIQIQLYSLQEQLESSESSSVVKKRINNIQKIQKSYKYRTLANQHDTTNFIDSYDDFLSNVNTSTSFVNYEFHDLSDGNGVISNSDVFTAMNSDVFLRDWEILSTSLSKKWASSMFISNYSNNHLPATPSLSLSICDSHPLFHNSGVCLAYKTTIKKQLQ